MSYKVGQVIFAILKKEASVYPIQVVEEITKRTLDGEITTHMVRIGADPTKIVAVNEVDGELFDSAEKAKKVLIERVSTMISQRVENAVLKAKEWYPSGFEHAPDDPLSIIKKSPDVVTHVQKPQPSSRSRMKPETEQLAAEFAHEAEESMMEVPDGKGGMVMARVKGIKLPSALSS